MGIGWIYFEHLERRNVFGDHGGRVLDIGAQHIFDIPVDEGIRFLRRHGSELDDGALDRHVRTLSRRSPWPASKEPIFLGEFLAGTKLDYVGLDIFSGPGVRVFDLNFEQLDIADASSFDVVLNFGTTEHVFNQYHCFKVIHEATKPNGYMYHQLPCSGYMDHGYWVYSPRMFIELAAANDYEVCLMWCSGPQGATHLFDHVSYRMDVQDATLPENAVEQWQVAPLVSGLVNVLLRKRSCGPFRPALDATTSAGDIDVSVLGTYPGADAAQKGRPTPVLNAIPARALAAELLRRAKRRLFKPAR